MFNEKNYQLLIAVQPGSASAKILSSHFPKAVFLPLQGYGIRYAKSPRLFNAKIIVQIPKILRAIGRERRFVRKVLQDYRVDYIVSDNRYGFRHPDIPSIFITHQLEIMAPTDWLKNQIQRINYRYIQRFNTLWIPDLPGPVNIAGALSHPRRMPAIEHHYIGPLSRLTLQRAAKPLAPFKYLMLLSGPEPQRTVLEKKLLAIARQLPGNNVLVRGLPTATTGDSQVKITAPDHLKIIPYADSEQLKALITAAQYVICRSGYSTVMDLMLAKKKAIFIATPRQTEQEYLALHLKKNGWGYSFPQSHPDYLGELQKAEAFDYRELRATEDLLTTLPIFQ